ncbi:MAG: hypothetical protein PVF83_18310 [Anaerolineales bacterium]
MGLGMQGVGDGRPQGTPLQEYEREQACGGKGIADALTVVDRIGALASNGLSVDSGRTQGTPLRRCERAQHAAPFQGWEWARHAAAKDCRCPYGGGNR